MALDLTLDILTTEEKAQQLIRDLEHKRTMEIEAIRTQGDAGVSIHHRLELLKHAKEVLIANRSNAPIGERDVLDEDIVKYATNLEKFLTS